MRSLPNPPWRRVIKDGNAADFGSLNLLPRGYSCNEEVSYEIKEHLDSLVDEIDRYFPGIDNEDIIFQLTRNPFNQNSTAFQSALKMSFSNYSTIGLPKMTMRSWTCWMFGLRCEENIQHFLNRRCLSPFPSPPPTYMRLDFHRFW